MASTACPTIIGNPAIGLVADGWDTFHGFATTSFNLATTALQATADFSVAPVDFNISFDLTEQVTGYQRPPTPDMLDITFNKDAVKDPGNVPIPSDISATFGPQPTANLVEPSINIDDGPGDLTAVAPGPAPPLQAVTIPTAPDLDQYIPAPPTLFNLSLPTPPTIPVRQFTGVKPVLDFEPPAQTWSFEPEDYTSALLDQLRSTVTNVLNGGSGLPVAVENALYARFVARDDESALRAEQETIEEFSSKGWSEPNGVLEARLRQTRQDSINARANATRDVYISNKQLENDNMKAYATLGVSLESKLIDNHLGIQQLILDGQKFILQSAIEIYNARATLFNAQLSAYQADAQVFRDLLQADLNQLEVYKAEIDAQRLIGEINSNLVAVYQGLLQSVNSRVEIYRSQIAGVEAQVSVNRSIIEAFGSEVSAYAETVRAYGIQWDAFKSKVDAQVSKERIYEISTNAFVARLGAWASANNNIIEQKKLILSQDDFKLRTWEANLEKMKAFLALELGRVDTVVKQNASSVDLYRGEAVIESAAADSNTRIANLEIAQRQAQVDTGLKNAQLHVEQTKNIASLLLEKLHGVAQVASQLAAASFSAVHFSAGASSSTTDSQACETVLQLQG